MAMPDHALLRCAVRVGVVRFSRCAAAPPLGHTCSPGRPVGPRRARCGAAHSAAARLMATGRRKSDCPSPRPRTRDLVDGPGAVGVGDVERVGGVVHNDAAVLARKLHQLGQLLARGGRAGGVVGRAEEDDVGAGRLRRGERGGAQVWQGQAEGRGADARQLLPGTGTRWASTQLGLLCAHVCVVSMLCRQVRAARERSTPLAGMARSPPAGSSAARTGAQANSRASQGGGGGACRGTSASRGVPWTGRGRSRSRGGTPCTRCCQSRCRCDRLRRGGREAPPSLKTCAARVLGCARGARLPDAGDPPPPPCHNSSASARALHAGRGAPAPPGLRPHPPVMPMITELSTYTG